MVITPLIFLAGLFFPLSSYPEHLLPFIKTLPTTALFEGARGALLSGKTGFGYMLELILSAAISFTLAVRIFERKRHG